MSAVMRSLSTMSPSLTHICLPNLLSICLYVFHTFFISVPVCGCGDDLNAGHDNNNPSQNTNMNTDDAQEDNRYVNFGRTFYNIGYRRRGALKDLDVLAVHPAGKVV